MRSSCMCVCKMPVLTVNGGFLGAGPSGGREHWKLQTSDWGLHAMTVEWLQVVAGLMWAANPWGSTVYLHPDTIKVGRRLHHYFMLPGAGNVRLSVEGEQWVVSFELSCLSSSCSATCSDFRAASKPTRF